MTTTKQAAFLARLRDKGLGLAPVVADGKIVRSKGSGKQPASGGVLPGYTPPNSVSGPITPPRPARPAERHTRPQAVTFTIEGEPASKGRPRFRHQNGRTITYTPAKTTAAERAVAEAFNAAAPGYSYAPDAAYQVDAVFYLGTRRQKDVDNMLKLVLDGLNGVAWADDHQVTKTSTEKIHAPGDARTVVTIKRAA